MMRYADRAMPTTKALNTAATPVELITKLFGETLRYRDADGMLAYLAPDVVDEHPTNVLHGPSEVRDHFAAMFAAFPDFEIRPERIVGDGEAVFVKWRATG